MLTLGPVAFAVPWMLLALAALPVLWWLLRVTPPSPKRVPFPPIRILMSLVQREETPARTPLWLLLLRLALAALVILALAGPLLNPGAQLAGSGPLVVVVDDGWPAAAKWQKRLDTLAGLVDQAVRADRPVALIRTAPPSDGEPFAEPDLIAPGEAQRLVRALEPKPWATDRAGLLATLNGFTVNGDADVIWLTDGIDNGRAADFGAWLDGLGRLQVIGDPPVELATALLAPEVEGQTLRLRALRAESGGQGAVFVRAIAEQGQVAARQPLQFEDGATAASAMLNLPVELRNRLTRLEIEGAQSAGNVVLMDERWRRRPVGLVSGGPIESDQPLLSEIFYLDRAMNPFAEVRTGTVGELMQRELAVLVLSDIGQVVGPERAALEAWVEAGGVLVRFAGPRMAESTDDLVPVRLRLGGRDLGGALSWSQPAKLAPFDESSPFHGLDVPAEVLIRRQVLAEPALDLGEKTWARLEDGTPLVTAEQRGDGRLVLFHTTANTRWSNLAISGLFVDMLRRIVDLSEGISGADRREALPPLGLLDGFGRLGDPGPAALPIEAGAFAETAAGPRHPPGYYGTDDARRALNATAGLERLTPITALPGVGAIDEYATTQEIDLQPWLLTAAVILGLIDFVIALGLRGLLPPTRPAAASIAVLLAAGMLATAATDARAQESDDEFALTATLETRLAFVRTGLQQVDDLSYAGLWGLTDMLRRRTSVEGAEPMGVDLEQDDILFFPLLYWPVVPEQPDLSDAALAKLDRYMKTGGTILFDTRDQDGAGAVGFSRAGPGQQRLRQILRRLDVPPLIPVPEDHVLTKAFYLMQDFPGRWAGGRVWVEARGGPTNDGVSAMVIGGNDWAAAWATDDNGRPMAAVVPGGERQREMAFRFGINLVMYALTGNYKADQVHVPAILERLGQ